MLIPIDLIPACYRHTERIELTHQNHQNHQNQAYTPFIPPTALLTFPTQNNTLSRKIPYPLILENLTPYLSYLKPSEVARLLMACRHFHFGGFWQALCKLQRPLSWKHDLFHLQINQIQKKDREWAYNRLFALRTQQLQEPWKVTAVEMIGIPSRRPYWPCIAILSNGYIVMGRRFIDILSRTCTQKLAVIAKDISHPTSGPISNIVALTDGRFITSASQGNQAHIWSALGELMATLEHDGRVTYMAACPNGDIMTGSKDTKVRRWTPEGKLVMTHVGHTQSISGVLLLQDGTPVSKSQDGTVFIWSLEGDQIPHIKHIGLTDMAGLQDGNLVTIARDGHAVIWSPKGKRVATFVHPSASGMIRIAVLQNGNMLTVGSNESCLRLWSPDGKALAILQGHTDKINSIATLPNGFVTGSDDHTARVWSLTGQTIAILKDHPYIIESVMVFQDGQIATLNLDGTLCIWSVDVEHLLRVHSVWNKAICTLL